MLLSSIVISGERTVSSATIWIQTTQTASTWMPRDRKTLDAMHDSHGATPASFMP